MMQHFNICSLGHFGVISNQKRSIFNDITSRVCGNWTTCAKTWHSPNPNQVASVPKPNQIISTALL